MTSFFINAIKSTSPVEFDFTDHNRSTLNFNYEQIESAIRTADGSMRKFVIAQKRSFDASWQMLPSVTSLTADGKPGAGLIRDFYTENVGKKITLEVVHHGSSTAQLSSSSTPSAPNGTKETINVFISSFSYEIVKRMPTYDYVNLSISFTEA